MFGSSSVQRQASEIIHSDQGSQYTCEHWPNTLSELQVKANMDGKGRATDNARQPGGSVGGFMLKDNRRRYQGIGRRKPIDRHRHAA